VERQWVTWVDQWTRSIYKLHCAVCEGQQYSSMWPVCNMYNFLLYLKIITDEFIAWFIRAFNKKHFVGVGISNVKKLVVKFYHECFLKNIFLQFQSICQFKLFFSKIQNIFVNENFFRDLFYILLLLILFRKNIFWKIFCTQNVLYQQFLQWLSIKIPWRKLEIAIQGSL